MRRLACLRAAPRWGILMRYTWQARVPRTMHDCQLGCYSSAQLEQIAKDCGLSDSLSPCVLSPPWSYTD